MSVLQKSMKMMMTSALWFARICLVCDESKTAQDWLFWGAKALIEVSSPATSRHDRCFEVQSVGRAESPSLDRGAGQKI